MNRNIIKIGSRLLLIFAAMLMLAFIDQTVQAIDKPDISLLSSNPATIREEGEAYYGIKVNNYSKDQAGITISYQWYCSTKAEAAKGNWYKIDKSYNWAQYCTASEIKISASKGQSEWAASEQRMIKCKVTVNNVSAFSPVIAITAQKAKYLDKVRIIITTGTTLDPVWGKEPNLSFKEDDKTNYEITDKVWQVWNPALETWITMQQTKVFASNSQYRALVTVKTKNGYGIGTSKANKTKCTIAGKQAKVTVSKESADEYYLSVEYLVNLSDNPNITRIDNHTLNVLDKPNGAKQDYLNYGNIIEILSIKEDWVEIRYIKEYAKTGFVLYDDIFEDLPSSYHYYACTGSKVTIRSGPGSDYDKEGYINYADIIYIDQEEDGWFHFNNVYKKPADTKSGWVKASYFEKTLADSKNRIDPTDMTVVNSTLTVRAEPSKNAARIGGLSKGKTFVATGRISKFVTGEGTYNWLVFTYRGQLAYILESYQHAPTKEIYIKDSGATNLDYEVKSVPVSVNSTVSLRKLMKPMNGNEAVEVVNVDNSEKTSLGLIRIYMREREGYSFPADLSKIKVDLGSVPDYYVKSISKAKSPDDCILVLLQEKDFCKKHGHRYNTTYTIDKMVTYKSNGSMSIHCKVCNGIKEKSSKTITKLKATSITYIQSKSSKKITLKWKKVPGAKGYQIRYTLGKTSKIIKVTSTKKCSYTLKKLKGRKKYKINVQAYSTVLGKNYYSKWSKTKQVKVKK